MDPMPDAYENTYERKTEVVTEPVGINLLFVKSIHGILKICEILLNFIILICVAADHNWAQHSTAGWVNFVAAITVICSSIFFIFYLFNLMSRLPGPWVLIEFCVLTVSACMHAIAMIVSAACYTWGNAPIAAAVFTAIAAVVYIAETVLRFRVHRETGRFIISMTGVSTTIATTRTTTTISGGPGASGNKAAGSPYLAGGVSKTTDGYIMP